MQETAKPIALFLPDSSDLVAWFRGAFLCDIHKVDPRIDVPHEPPLLSQPADWYTPEERELAERILQIERDVSRLNQERDERQNELILAGHRADNGIRRALWSDGDDLVAAVQQLLSQLGFTVRDMDAGLRPDEPRREDLRLTLQSDDRWEAIVEVKGYASGTRTNDARHNSRAPRPLHQRRGPHPRPGLYGSLTRTVGPSPSSRPAPDSNVGESAITVGAVYVQSTDLYRQWAPVAAPRTRCRKSH